MPPGGRNPSGGIFSLMGIFLFPRYTGKAVLCGDDIYGLIILNLYIKACGLQWETGDKEYILLYRMWKSQKVKINACELAVYVQ